MKGDGTGSLSIYGSSFPLEAPPPPEAIQGLTGSAATAAAAKAIAAGSVPHFRAGLLCMANSAASSSKQQQQPQDPKQQQQRSGTNGCQFFITCGSCLWLDGRNDVFGQVIGRDSYQVCRNIERLFLELLLLRLTSSIASVSSRSAGAVDADVHSRLLCMNCSCVVSLYVLLLQVLRKIEHVSTDAQGMPKVDITITECGEL